MAIQKSNLPESGAGRPLPFLALGYLLAACALPAASYAADNPGAHEHGHARLQLAIEDNTIDLMFTSPAYNLAGFEHEARTEEEEQQLAEIRQWLKTTPLANTDSANCRVTAAVVELGDDRKEGQHHAHHDEDHHDHGDDHQHGNDHDEEATHREYDVSQQLECDDIGSTQVFTTELMGEFENLEELTVEWVSPSGQGSTRLTSTSRAFTINQ